MEKEKTERELKELLENAKAFNFTHQVDARMDEWLIAE